MNKRRVFLAAAILVSLLVAVWYAARTFFRLELIKMTIDAELPWWLLRALWGW